MARYRKNSPMKKFLTVALVALALVALFLISFGVTSLILKANQQPDIIGNEMIVEDASPTPKPTYEELELILKEKDDRILELETQLSEALEALTENNRPTEAPVIENAATQAPVATKAPAPVATKAPQPTAAPAPVATQTPSTQSFTGSIPIDFGE